MGDIPRTARRLFLPALCLLSVALNVWLALHGHRLEQRMRLDPLELGHYAPIRPPPKAAPGVRRVALFGDSRARSWPEPEPIPGVAFENRGIGYQTTAQVLGRFEEDIAPLAPTVVVLELGVNDLAVPVDELEHRRVVQRCKANIAALVRRCVASRAHVFLLSIFPVGPTPWYRWPFVSRLLVDDVAEVNRFLATLVTKHVELLDTSTLLQDESGYLRDEYRRDFLHVNEAGYSALDAQLHRALLRVLTQLPSPDASGE